MSNEQRFLRTVLRSQFGDVIDPIVETLLIHPTLTLTQLHHHANTLNNTLTLAQVKQSLLTLIQHDAVTVSYEAVTKAKVADSTQNALRVLYALNANTVRMSQRSALYLEHITAAFDDRARSVVLCFIQHGQLNKPQINHILTRETRTTAPNTNTQVHTASEILDIMRQLVRSRVIVTADTARVEETVVAVPTKRGRSADNKTDATQKKKRKTKAVTANTTTDMNEDEGEAEYLEEQAVSSSDWVRQMLADESPTMDDEDDDVVYQINHKYFTHQFRIDTVVNYFRTHHTATAANIARAMMGRSLIDATHCKTLVEILNAVNALPAEIRPKLLIPQLTQYLVEMSLDEAAPLRVERDTFGINLSSLYTAIRLQHIQSVCKERFGEVAARLYKLLIEYIRLEETQIVELSTAPRKLVRTTLHSMHIAQLVSIQEVPKQADRAPNRSFFLYSIPIDLNILNMKESLLMTYCNIRIRLNEESNNIRPIIEKIESGLSISLEERQRVDGWKRGSDRMEAALIELIQLIEIFSTPTE